MHYLSSYIHVQLSFNNTWKCLLPPKAASYPRLETSSSCPCVPACVRHIYAQHMEKITDVLTDKDVGLPFMAMSEPVELFSQITVLTSLWHHVRLPFMPVYGDHPYCFTSLIMLFNVKLTDVSVPFDGTAMVGWKYALFLRKGRSCICWLF